MTGAFPAKSLQSPMKRLDSNSPNGLVSEPQADAMRCDYVAHLFKDWVRQNVADENRLALVYRCATRSALWANNKSVKRCNVGFGKSWRCNSPHVYTVLIKKPNRAEHSFTRRFNNPRHARQHFLQRRAG